MRTCVNLVNKICNSIQLFARPKILFCWERGRERESWHLSWTIWLKVLPEKETQPAASQYGTVKVHLTATTFDVEIYVWDNF